MWKKRRRNTAAQKPSTNQWRKREKPQDKTFFHLPFKPRNNDPNCSLLCLLRCSISNEQDDLSIFLKKRHREVMRVGGKKSFKGRKRFRGSALATSLVQSATADVTNPFDNVMIRIVQFGLEDFQIADFKSRRSERNLSKHQR